MHTGVARTQMARMYAETDAAGAGRVAATPLGGYDLVGG
jgi:hypothetical protein